MPIVQRKIERMCGLYFSEGVVIRSLMKSFHLVLRFVHRSIQLIIKEIDSDSKCAKAFGHVRSLTKEMREDTIIATRVH